MTYISIGKLARLVVGTQAAIAMVSMAHATVFSLTGADIVTTPPTPLFSDPISITGTFTLDDSILPGDSFGSGALTALTLNFGGIVGTLADVQADIAPGPVQLFGTRSLDGDGFSVLDFRFGFSPATTPGCSFFCAGQIIINSPIGPNDPSSFFAADDPDAETLSLIDSFTPQFAQVAVVPEIESWTMMITGFGLAGVVLRRRRRNVKPISI